MFNLLHLDGYLLYIADRCHICFAWHFQTVSPIPMFFISISTEITSPFQWHTWISKLRSGSFFPCPNLAYASHIASRIAYHVCIMLFEFARGWFVLFACLSCLGRPGRRVREWGARWVRLRGSSQLWQLCRQDDHTLEITSIFVLLDARSFAMPMLWYLPLSYHASQIAMSNL